MWCIKQARDELLEDISNENYTKILKLKDIYWIRSYKKLM